MAYRAAQPRPVRLNINGDVPTPFILPYTWYVKQRLYWQLPKVLSVTVTADGELDNTRYKAVANDDCQFGLRVSFNLTEALDKYTGYHLVKVAKVNQTELHFHLSKYTCPCNYGSGCGAACGRAAAGAGAAAGATKPVAEVLSRRATPAGADLVAAVAEAAAAGELGSGVASGDAAGSGPSGSGESTETRAGAAPAAGAAGTGKQGGAGAAPAGGTASGSRPNRGKRLAEDDSDGEGGNSATSGSSSGGSSSRSGSGDSDSSGSSSDSDDGGAVSPEPVRNNPFRQEGHCSCPCHVWRRHWPDPDDPRKHQDHQDQERAGRRGNRAAYPRARAHARQGDDSDAEAYGGDEGDEDWELQAESSGRGRKRAGSREPAGGAAAAAGARPARRPRVGSGGGARGGAGAADSAGGGSDSHPGPQRAGSSGGAGGRCARGSSGGGAAGSVGGDDSGFGPGSQRPPLAEVVSQGNGSHPHGQGAGGSLAGKGRPRGQRAPSSATAGADGDDGEERLQAAPRGGSRAGAGRGASAPPRPPLPPSHAQQQQQQQQRRRPAPQQQAELQPRSALLEQWGMGLAAQQRLGLGQVHPAELGPGGQPLLLGRVVPVQLQQAGGMRPELAVVQLVCNGELVPGPFPCPVLWDAGPLPAVQLPEAVQGMQLRFLGWGAQDRDPDTLLLLTTMAEPPTGAAAAGPTTGPASRSRRGGAVASAAAGAGARHAAAAPEPADADEGAVLTGRSDVGIPGDVLRDYLGHCGGMPQHMVVELDGQVVPEEYPVLVLDDMGDPATEASIQPGPNGEVMLRLHGVPPHVAGMLLTGWGATEQNGASVLVLRVGRPPTPPHPAAAALAPHLPPLDMLSTQPLLGPGPLPAHQDTWVGPPLGAIAQLTALTVGMAVPGAAGELPGMVRLAAVPTPDLQLPPILLAPPENQRPPCRASWEVKPLEFYTRLRRGERIRGDRMPLEPRLHREHLHGGWGLRRLFVERDGYVDICTAAWCVYITERAKSAFVEKLPPHARNCYFLGWGLMPGGELVLRVSSKQPPDCVPPNAPNAPAMAVHKEALAMAVEAAGIAKYYEEVRLLRAAQGRRTPANEEEEQRASGGMGAVRVGMKRGNGVLQRKLMSVELLLDVAPSFPTRLPITANRGAGGGSAGKLGPAR
ncbi:hypothetical protein CHLRE_06g298450v5 [Chlamydomonas reinhardtii]|uniref:Uncharacterized protein n=1 Tax=Chlamydomonas reinhardtii TaxID=3055 RepID=A0A2K3DQT4_CHLRE|nr:uncharacterized protein CHLRE_06g298450v5 [Chlamydomonas reinhardtii]PNW82890.1 hypothetical protein CHLRE_06g298450v5 [Chlamydomonas reinhardtii]